MLNVWVNTNNNLSGGMARFQFLDRLLGILQIKDTICHRLDLASFNILGDDGELFT